MSSWIKCPCGNLLHKNLFCGAHVCVVLEDELLDALDKAEPASETLDQITRKSDILVRCNKCNRIAIEESASGAISFFTKEPPDENHGA